jgi:hypothetical protein
MINFAPSLAGLELETTTVLSLTSSPQEML